LKILQLMCVVMLFGAPVSAQSPSAARPAPGADSTLDRRTRELASQLRCPVCQGLSINDSPAELAVEMKGVVREQLAAGKSPGEVRQYFIEKYGEWVLLEPDPRGFNMLVYAIPVLALLGGGAFVWRYVRRLTRRDDVVEHPL
jgi:cytochrome c-type biogenesis protein CcmH